jgi:hypothetical protein
LQVLWGMHQLRRIYCELILVINIMKLMIGWERLLHNDLWAKSTDELMAKYLYARVRLLQLIDEGTISHGKNADMEYWSWDQSEINDLKNELSAIQK